MNGFFARIAPSASLIGTVALLVFAGFPIHIAQAFSVSPVTIDLETAPGAVARGEMHITNTSDEARTYYVSIQKFVASGEDGQQKFLPDTDVSGLASWIAPQALRITLKPHETVPFAYAVNVPANAEPGGHYAALFFSNRPDNGTEGQSAIGIGAKVGVLFLVRVPGDIREDARVESFRVTDADPLDHLPAHFELRLRNLGSVHLRPQGSIVITNMFGGVSANIPVNPRQGAVLPNSIRRLETAWTKTSMDGTGGFFSELKNEWSNFAIGRYTAEVQGTYGSTHRPIVATASFWVIPWRILLAAALLVLAILLCVKMYNRMVINAVLKGGSNTKR